MIQDGDQLSHKTSQKWWRCHGCLQRILITGRAVEMDSQKRSPANSQCLTCLLLGENTHETHMEKRKKFYLFLDLNFAIPKESTQKIVCKNESKRFHIHKFPLFFALQFWHFAPLGRWLHPQPQIKKNWRIACGNCCGHPDSRFYFYMTLWPNGMNIFAYFSPDPAHIHAGWVKMGDILIIWLSSFALKMWIESTSANCSRWDLNTSHDPTQGSQCFPRAFGVLECTGELDPPNHDNRKNND